MSAPIAWLDDTTVGQWIADGQLTQHGTVGAFVPPLFDSYVLVRPAGDNAAINPARALREHLVARLADYGVDVERCVFAISDVYGWNGQTTVGAAPLVFDRLVEGERALEELHRRLLEHGTPPAASRSRLPSLLETRLRSYMLYRGPLDDAGAAALAGGPTEVPDLWWPESRTWFVATDTDLDAVIVAGPSALTASLAAPGFSTQSVNPRSFLA